MAVKKNSDLMLPPHNLEAEESLLGAVLLESETLLPQIADILKPDDFYKEAHRLIFEAIFALWAKHEPIDTLTVSNILKDRNQLDELGGIKFLAKLTSNVPLVSNAPSYAKTIKRKSLLRQLIHAGNNIAHMGFKEDAEVELLMDEAEKNIFRVTQSSIRQNFIPLGDLMTDTFERIDHLHEHPGELRGISTGFKSLDMMLGGLQKSDLVVLAARPSVGKTSLALDIARSAALKTKLPIALFSLEMSKEQLAERLISSHAKVELWRLRTGRLAKGDDTAEFDRLSQAIGELSTASLFIDDMGLATVLDIRSKTRRLMSERGELGMIVIDYIQLMTSGNQENRVQEVSEITRGLKGIARELDVPVLALSQLNRGVESRSPAIPRLADLRESGCLSGETLITLNDGSRLPLKNLVGKKNFSILALNNENYKIEAQKVSKVFLTGQKKIFHLTTRLGRTIDATANHKFYTLTGWKRLDELRNGDRLALPRLLPSNKGGNIFLPEVALLGHLIGDGHTLPAHSIQYTTNDLKLARQVSALAKKVFGAKIAPRVKRERAWYQVYLTASEPLSRQRCNPITDWLTGLGIFGLRSYEKFIPAQIFSQNLPTLAVFLKHLWATDGCIKAPTGQSKTRHPALYYASSSLRLARDIQSLLLRFGINAVVTKHDQGAKGRPQYHILIMGQNDILTFAKKIGAVSDKQKKALQASVLWLKNRTANTNRDVVSAEVWQSYIKPLIKKYGLTDRAFQKSLGMSYAGNGLYKQNLSRNRLARVAKILKNDQRLSALAQSDVYWDEIVAIKPGRIEEVFDLTVPAHHNFIANDIIAHNSIEQDADVVMFIYRKSADKNFDPRELSEEDLHKAEIHISKHRNGPTGIINLVFQDKIVSFTDADTHHTEG